MKPAIALLALLFLFQTADARENAPLVVHEWGTFTSLQDESGQAIGGINTDDEPVPDFVHTIRGNILLWPTELPPSFFAKGFPRLHPHVTMRLETPVMYFYPPADSPAPMELDVRASFRGGWLTEYYPRAKVDAPGLTRQVDNGGTILGGIDEHTVGALTWKGLRLGVHTEGPQTEEKVWLAPRQVSAASVATPDGESEKYLFYRGVGHLNALLRVHRSADADWLEIRRQSPAADALTEWTIGDAWLAHIRHDGSSAFRHLGSLATRGTEEVLAQTPARFATDEFAPQNLALLRADMRRALIAEGLFADEADAMLNTWEVAYFQSPGLRLFFTVPQAWTDYYLPLEFSASVELTRIMVGRIEIIAPEQRALLAQIAAHPVESFPNQTVRDVLAEGGENWSKSPIYQRIFKGEMAVADLGVPLPESFLAYLELGRLRNALILNEFELRPTPSLAAFIDKYRLTGYSAPEPEPPEIVPATPPTRPMLTEHVAGWTVSGDRGAQILGPLVDGPIFNGEATTAVQVSPEPPSTYWGVTLSPPQQLVRPDFAGLRLAFHPGDTEPASTPMLLLSIDDQSVDLARRSTAYQLDLARREWQVLEVPFAVFQSGERDLLETVSPIRLEGNLNGTFYLGDVDLVEAISPAAITAVLEERSAALPASFDLEQNYPNPFNSETVIRFALPQSTTVELAVYNLAGQKVAQLVHGLREAGRYTVHWDGRVDDGEILATGMYIYRLRAGSRMQSRKLLLLR